MSAVPSRKRPSNRGQDLIEYSLLVAFILLAAAAIYIGAGHQIESFFKPTPQTTTQPAPAK